MSTMKHNWQKIELNEILSISSKKFNPIGNNENKKCVELEHLSQETGKLLGYTNSSEQQSIKNSFEEGQILFGKLRPYLKKFWKAEFEGVCSSEIWVMSGKKVKNDFLFYLVQTEKFNQIANVSSGSKMPRADWNYMSEIPFDIPPLKEQEKIAEILTTWDESITKQTELLREKELQKKALMQKLLSDEVRFDGFSDEWEEVRLSNILFEHGEKSDSKSEVYSVSVHKGIINQIEHLGRSYSASDTSNYNLVKPYDIVYTKSPTGEFPYGIVKQNMNKFNVIVSPLYGVFSPINRYIGYILHVYFESFIRTNNYLKSIIQKGAKNTINITNSTFLSKSILLPKNENEQQKIAKVLSLADEEINLLKNELEELKLQKKALMQKLLTGQVRVKV